MATLNPTPVSAAAPYPPPAAPRSRYHLTPEQVVRVKQEMADVFLYLIRLADRLDVDLMTAAAEKLEIKLKCFVVQYLGVNVLPLRIQVKRKVVVTGCRLRVILAEQLKP